MTQEQRDQFLYLAKKQEELKEELGTVSEELQTFLKAFPLGTYVQDDVTLLVYKFVKPTGTFMYYKDVDYVRTAKEGERSGSLSKKEAEENGFLLPLKK